MITFHRVNKFQIHLIEILLIKLSETQKVTPREYFFQVEEKIIFVDPSHFFASYETSFN
jgi:hypothetical protein